MTTNSITSPELLFVEFFADGTNRCTYANHKAPADANYNPIVLWDEPVVVPLAQAVELLETAKRVVATSWQREEHGLVQYEGEKAKLVIRDAFQNKNKPLLDQWIDEELAAKERRRHGITVKMEFTLDADETWEKSMREVLLRASNALQLAPQLPKAKETAPLLNDRNIPIGSMTVEQRQK